MPTSRSISKVLTDAGLIPSDVVPSRPGQRAENSRGFRVQPSNVDRRIVHVFHQGRGQRLSLEQYADVLRAAGYLVKSAHGGLRVATSRNPTDRKKTE
jgi:hypothetical protein